MKKALEKSEVHDISKHVLNQRKREKNNKKEKTNHSINKNN